LQLPYFYGILIVEEKKGGHMRIRGKRCFFVAVLLIGGLFLSLADAQGQEKTIEVTKQEEASPVEKGEGDTTKNPIASRAVLSEALPFFPKA
jgi:hypothetical protein